MQTGNQTSKATTLICLRCGNQRHGDRCERVLGKAYVNAEGEVCYTMPLQPTNDRPGYRVFPAVTEERFWLGEYDRQEIRCRSRCGGRYTVTKQSLRQVLYAARDIGLDAIDLATLSKFPSRAT